MVLSQREIIIAIGYGFIVAFSCFLYICREYVDICLS